MSSYSTSLIPSGIQILPSAIDFPAVGLDGQQLVAADTNTIYIYQEQAPAGWKPVANPGAAIAIDALTGEVTATGPGVVAATITNAAVTNAKLAAMADNTVKGNKSGAPASPSDLALSNVTEAVSSVLTISNGSKTVVSAADLTIEVKQSSAVQSGYLSSGDWSTFSNKVSSVGATAPIASSGGTTPTISISQSGVATDGYLSSADWNTFNSKQNALMFGNLSGDNNANISITGGTGAVIGLGTTISQTAASALSNGYLTSADWSTFNSKQNALTTGNLSEVTSSVLTISGGTGCVIGSGTTIQVQQAGPATSGYLSSADYTTFSGKQPAGNYITDLTGEVTASGPGSVAATIANNAVTNAKLAQIATQTIKGRTTAGTGNVEDLTATQATAILNTMVGDSGAGGTKGLVPAPAAGDAAAGKYLKADGSWATVSGLPTQTGNQYKVLATDGSAASWQFAGLGDGSYPSNTVVLGRGLPSLMTATSSVLIGTGSNLGTGTSQVIIGASSGRSTSGATGANNTVVGSGSFNSASLTTANANTIVGQGSGTSLTTGSGNVILGYSSANSIAGGTRNVLVGSYITSGDISDAVMLGTTLSNPNLASNTITIGSDNVNSSSNTIVIGMSSNGAGGTYSTLIGTNVGRRPGVVRINTDSTVAVGSYSCGSQASAPTATNTRCIYLGNYAGAYSNGQTDELFIDNQSRTSYANQQTKSIIYGVMNATETSQTLSLNAQVNLAYGERHAVATKTATPISVAAYDYTIAVDTATIAGASAVNLPAVSAADKGRVYNIKDLTGSAATYNIVVNVAAGSGNLIDGASSQTINTAYGSMMIQSDGSNRWMIL